MNRRSVVHRGAVSRRRRAALRLAPRGGYTLLEVVLALGLSVFVLGLLGTAIQVNLKATNTGRDDVVQAQLARAVLGRMADDLRAAVWYESVGEPWSSGASTTSDDGSTGSDSGFDSAGESNGGASSGGSSSDDSSDSFGDSESDATSTDSDDESTDGAASGTGLYGGTDWIELDISRLPSTARPGIGASQNFELVPTPESDLRRVMWCLASATMVGVEGTTPILPDGAEGLMRREWDAAIARYLGTVAAETAREATDVLAPEVASLGFRYFDGTEWWYEWDSAEQGGLPMLIEIGVAFAPIANEKDGRREYTAPVSLDLAEQNGMTVYRTIVAPPAARPPSDAADSSSSMSGGI